MFHYRITKIVILMLMLSLSSIGAVVADQINYAPLACDLAAPSELTAGMNATPTQQVEPAQLVAQFDGAEAVLTALLDDLIANNLLGRSHAVFADPALAPVVVDQVAPATQVEIVGDPHCISYFDGNMVVRYWQVITPQGNGYMIEAVRWETAEIAYNNGDGVINMQVEDMILRLLNPVYTPVVPLGTGNEVVAPDAALGADYCDGTPTSYLQVGMQAEMFAEGWAQFYNFEDGNWTTLNEPVALNAFGLGVLNTVDDRGLLLHAAIDPYSQDAISITSDAVKQAFTIAPIVDIIDGPYCVAENVYPANGSQYDFPDRFMTYWRIRVEINGAIHTGWFPENSAQDTWWQANGNTFPNLVTSYHLHPYGENTASNNAACPPSAMYASLTVEPNVAPLNLRQDPAGTIIGRVEMREAVVLYGEPVCEGGSNWWSTSRGGFIAENDPSTNSRLIQPYTPDPTPMPAQPETVNTQPQNNDRNAQPPVVESTPISVRPVEPTAEPTRLVIPVRPVDATPEPTRPPRGCDPVTGRGC